MSAQRRYRINPTSSGHNKVSPSSDASFQSIEMIEVFRRTTSGRFALSRVVAGRHSRRIDVAEDLTDSSKRSTSTMMLLEVQKKINVSKTSKSVDAESPRHLGFLTFLRAGQLDKSR